MTTTPTSLDSETDRALDDVASDEFGFAEIAKKLAPSLVDAAKSDGMVIGIEGPWGSGKTSLLNFLRQELADQDKGKLHVITLAPWLTGDAVSLVGSLTGAMADILDSQEEAAQSSGLFGLNKKRAAKYGDLFRQYGIRTGRTLAPLATVAAMIYPPAAIVGAGLGLGVDYLEKLGRNPTDAEVKKLISDKLASLDVRFLVLIDDLDRLEPPQAVEVIRMVRSVADFPKVAYVMCYDRSILAHALEKGLQVKDGDVFLQKVVQLTFSIPLPEPFDLRLSLREKVLAIYREVNGRDPDTEEADEIRTAVDREGAGLKTPREVKLVLNAIKFAYRNMAEDLYFPDLCRISLLKILNPPLYRWLENYLSVRSVVFTGDARVGQDDIEEIGNELGRLLPSDSAGSTRSIWTLATYIPGIQTGKDAKKRVFQAEYENKQYAYIEKKRLGSPLHYRFYFALNGPKSALSDAKFAELLSLAKTDPVALATKLREYIDVPRPLGQSWLEHIIDRFSKYHLLSLDVDQLRGLATAVVEVIDTALAKQNEVRFMTRSVSDKARILVGDVVDLLEEKAPSVRSQLLDVIFESSSSLSWLVGDFLRTELFAHGIVGDQAKSPEERHLSAEEITRYSTVLKSRLGTAAENQTLAAYPELSGLLWGWRNLAGGEAPRAWVEAYTADDDALLSLLLEMRGVSVSDRVYQPLRKSHVEQFMDWESMTERLVQMAAQDLPPQRKERLEQVETAIELGANSKFG